MDIPRISSYGDYSSTNYGAHCLRVEVGSLTLYFSYETVVAFRAPHIGLVCRKNVWGPTTGKHLNAIQPNKKVRIEGEEFEKILRGVLEHYRFTETSEPSLAKHVERS